MISEGTNKRIANNKKYDSFEKQKYDKGTHIDVMARKHLRHRAYQCDFGDCDLQDEEEQK